MNRLLATAALAASVTVTANSEDAAVAPVGPAEATVSGRHCGLIASDGTDLNPMNMVLDNEVTRCGLEQLYSELRAEMPGREFQFLVTGGDRYAGDGVIFSATTHEIIRASAKSTSHIGGMAADIRIRGVPAKIVLRALERTVFAQGYNYQSCRDYHWHVSYRPSEKQSRHCAK